MTEKYCKTCTTTKSVSEFYKDIRNTTGYSARCMPCQRETVRQSQKTPHGLLISINRNRRMYAKYSHKVKARSAARNAVKAGRIIKPEQCEGCGNQRPLQAHHEDYDKPLDVQFYCVPCHNNAHGKLVDKSLIKENI